MKYCDDQFKTKRIYTAWDNRKDEDVFFRGIDILVNAGINPANILVYMLCGYWDNESFEDDVLYRFNKMTERKLLPYPMVFDPTRNKKLKKFQRSVVGRYCQIVSWNNYIGNKRYERDTGADLFAE